MKRAVDGIGTLPLTALDTAFSRFLAQQQPSADGRHAWLAALASHQFGRGHACLDLDQLAQSPGDLLGWDADALCQLPADLAGSASSLPWVQGAGSPLVATPADAPRRLYLRRAWSAEQQILRHLADRQRLPIEPPANLAAQLDRLFPDAVPAGSTDWQRVACETAARHRIALITGGPGTGKTTTVLRLLALLAADARDRGRPFVVKLAAPTGKAASRLSQSIGAGLARLPEDLREGLPTNASTLHRLLGLQGEGTAPTAPPLVADLVVVDEASMIDLEMMARLLAAVPVSARLVLLGDKDQLASVEAGAVLAQLCERPDLAPQRVILRHSHRFDAASGIGRWATRINESDAPGVLADWDALPRWSATGADVIRRLDAAAARGATLEDCVRHGWSGWRDALAAAVARTHGCDDADALALLDAFARFQVLCALREGPWGVEQLNLRIQRALGLPLREHWYAGRPVMVTRNDYALKLMNGDVGLCLPQAGGTLRVAFRDAEGRLRWVQPARLESVDTVFAMTVHKSQGSEFDDLLLVLPDTPSPVVTRELFYTGLTRARQRATLQAPSREVLRQAVEKRVRRSGGLAGD